MALRVLHSSDWHLGGSFEGVSRREDHLRFFEWLGGCVRQQQVDVLLLSGDIFDVANPSAESLALWYEFLSSLEDSPVSDVVVIAGNHDSASRLEAPAAVLDRVGVHVRGTFVDDEESKERLLVPIGGEAGAPSAVVVALPYMHEYRLGIRVTELLGDEVQLRASFRERFTGLYSELVDRARARWGDVPILGMGHLTAGAEGSSSSDDYPAAIHMVGGIGGLPESVFDERLSYVALGHIHRMMPVGEGRAWYSGTPVASSVKEWETSRRVLLVELPDEADGFTAAECLSATPLRPEAVEVPHFRGLQILRGPADEVIERLSSLSWGESLPPFVLAELELDAPDQGQVARVRMSYAERWGSEDEENRPRLVRITQLVARPATESSPTVLPSGKKVADLSPEDVFMRLCESRSEQVDAELLAAFRLVASPSGEEGAP